MPSNSAMLLGVQLPEGMNPEDPLVQLAAGIGHVIKPGEVVHIPKEVRPIVDKESNRLMNPYEVKRRFLVPYTERIFGGNN